MSLQEYSLPIVKVSATGNDFLLIDLRTSQARETWAKELAHKSRREWVSLWCDRHEGLGADGAFFLESDAHLNFRWDFYNSDGGQAEMCGNAARAVSWYVHRTSGETELKFGTLAGEVEAMIESQSKISVQLPAIAEFQWDQSALDLKFDFVRAGVPHAVVKVDDLKNRTTLTQTAVKLKELTRFQRDGVNVTFVHSQSATQIESVTFERGVEGFTRSCGTGAVSAAYSVLRGKENVTVEVGVPGGRLFVIWKNGRPRLSGPAKIVAEMHWMRSE